MDEGKEQGKIMWGSDGGVVESWELIICIYTFVVHTSLESPYKI
jgi:hypothetical protein